MRAILALAQPTWGPTRLALQFARPEQGGSHLAPATLYRFLRRVRLQTRWQPLAVLEVHSARTAGLLTRRRLPALAAARRQQARYLTAEQPGDLVRLDTLYIGEFKGPRKVWQYTACDPACSYTVAEVATGFSAHCTAHFLTAQVPPTYAAPCLDRRGFCVYNPYDNWTY